MKEIADTSGKTSIEAFPLVSKIPKRLRMPIYAGLTTLGVAGGVGAVCNSKETPKLSELQQHLGYSAALPFATGEQWWITSGPHADGLSDGVRYALDFAPSTPIACPGSEPYREKFVRAIGDGVVTVSGNENDPNDKNHSIVELDHGNTFTTGYMHLDEIQVEVGQKVKQGDPLGFASCESPAGGGTGGIHSHVYAELSDKPIEIDRVVLSGWTISATEGNYQGVMEKAGEQTRTADRRRCGPNQETIDECGGIRNDIRWEEIQLETKPTISIVPTVRPVETIAVPVIPTVEKAKDGQGTVDVNGWQFRLKSWEELPAFEAGVTPIVKEGWKRVMVKADLVNLTGSVRQSHYEMGRFIMDGAIDVDIESDGFEYQAHVGTPNYTLSPERIVLLDSFPNVDVANGFSVPVAILAEVPSNKDNYILSFADLRTGSVQNIQRGEVYSSGGVDTRFGDVEVKNVGEVWDIPGFANIKCVGVENRQATTIFNGTFTEQFFLFEVENKYGQDIKTRYRTEIGLLIYLADGRVLEGSPYYYAEGIESVESVAPGLKKIVHVEFANDALADEGLGGLVNSSGATAVLTISDYESTKHIGRQSIACKLP